MDNQPFNTGSTGGGVNPGAAPQNTYSAMGLASTPAPAPGAPSSAPAASSFLSNSANLNTSSNEVKLPEGTTIRQLGMAVTAYMSKCGYGSKIDLDNLPEKAVNIQQFSAALMLDKQTSFLNGIQSFNVEESSIDSYNESYRRLRTWVDASLDVYRHELVRIMWPVFVHVFLELHKKVGSFSLGACPCGVVLRCVACAVCAVCGGGLDVLHAACRFLKYISSYGGNMFSLVSFCLTLFHPLIARNSLSIHNN